MVEEGAGDEAGLPPESGAPEGCAGTCSLCVAEDDESELVDPATGGAVATEPG